ncbi:pilus assembly protein TadG-related protein [Streptomyces sp. NPDC049915]|uniref:pilus assembly protein TadG-related protein n=1 Tax=Streptomyces sp. NPDC049915 TaxID=3155510 RepID=UPI00341F77B6
MAGLLFLALAYLAVGQAGANRNGAQTAADAAALAAAQDTRDQLAARWVADIRDPDKWQSIFDGDVAVDSSCPLADQLAARNDAHVERCAATGPLGYEVEVKADNPVGDSIVPGTESRHAIASARAVIEPLCGSKLPGKHADDVLPLLTCKDGDWQLDPQDPKSLPEPQDLFDVHLAE